MKEQVDFFTVLFATVEHLRIKYVREILSCMREEDTNPDTFMPEFGFTMGQFSTGYILKR